MYPFQQKLLHPTDSGTLSATRPVEPTRDVLGNTQPSAAESGTEATLPAPGTRIGEHYLLVRELGRGAMGVVMLARDESLRRDVAVKFIRGDGLDPEFFRQFVEEAQAMARVNHPNVLCIHSYGEFNTLPYFVAEYVPGQTLERWLGDNEAAPDVTTSLALLDAICAGVEAIHAAGTVHRDLKPSNILLDAELRARVADFGVSRNAMEGNGEAFQMAGTPAYMAPEVAQAAGCSGAPSLLSDVYSLGCIAFELLTGQRPFQSETAVGWLINHATTPVPAPSHIRPGLPKALDAVVLRALDKQPGNRTASVTELRQGLHAAARGDLSSEH
jgi:serine/threonine-protein kinase